MQGVKHFEAIDKLIETYNNFKLISQVIANFQTSESKEKNNFELIFK